LVFDCGAIPKVKKDSSMVLANEVEFSAVSVVESRLQPAPNPASIRLCSGLIRPNPTQSDQSEKAFLGKERPSDSWFSLWDRIMAGQNHQEKATDANPHDSVLSRRKGSSEVIHSRLAKLLPFAFGL
jgi:hypothetical protein